MSYTHFTIEERNCLQHLLAAGKSFREIADILQRSPSTICREVNRNKSRFRPHKKSDNKYYYNSWRAQNLYILRRRDIKRRAIRPCSVQWNYIVDKLNKFWSPEQICGRWHLEHPNEKMIHFSSIYHYIYRGELPPIKAKTHLRRRGKRLMPRNSCYNSIHPDHIIPDWPDEIRRRNTVGHWEGDTVYGAIGKGLIITMVERKSRYLRCKLLDKRDSGLTKDSIVSMLDGLPVLSISLDNGSEFSQFRAIEEELKTVVYFAEPHKPWQRGTNENTNDILRFYFPKGFDFHSITQKDLDRIVEEINNRPRKCLGWKTPAEIFLADCVALH